ncbi:hypothetical protein LEP1GSC186_0475 [Leptospira noguchii serovar Autumnalis str. ZUN142]|uniref:Uncharacterized protein n=1 Tax=Leptospira noguchii serovar Autumnalis str. ZUN142 TaxID=1085540 RepID=M6UMH8_9LEPT|nr:hypothetical protein LEP1GSC186_0475 [Leptospira noguchii serovar Autumnalis str. ZUN142]
MFFHNGRKKSTYKKRFHRLRTKDSGWKYGFRLEKTNQQSLDRKRKYDKCERGPNPILKRPIFPA